MWKSMASSVLNALAQSTIVDLERPGGMARPDADAWWAALGLPERPSFSDTPAPAEARALADFIAPGISKLLTWISTASLDDMLLLTPPSTIAAENSTFPNPELEQRYSWAVDHFSSTFYSEWETSSLHYAYRWLSDNELPPCSPSLMDARSIDKPLISDEIARRASVREDKPTINLDIIAILVDDMVEYALSLLSKGDCRAAAEVFEFKAERMPYDGTSRNNVGFCLIPVDPSLALGHLRAANEMKFPQPAINIFNQMCCYIALRCPREALALADAMWPTVCKARRSGATLWARESPSNNWELFHTDDVRYSLAELAISTAHDEGCANEESTWRGRLKILTG